MATYKQIQDYIREKHGFAVKTCWIAHMKEVCGIPVQIASNRYSPDNRTHPCPPDKQAALRDAFVYFKMIR